MVVDEDIIARAAGIEGLTIKDAGLLGLALTHPSVPGRPSYQRLEFLGDRVLGLIVATWLYEAFPEEPEGKLNRRFTALVRRETLASVARELDIGELVRVEAGAAAVGTHLAENVLADVCEALIGALYLDGGLAAAEAFVRRHWRERVKAGPKVYKDAKTALQEWAQGRGLPVPEYVILSRSGPDHDPEFEIEARIEGHPPARARGKSRREAEQAAAGELFGRLAGNRAGGS